MSAPPLNNTFITIEQIQEISTVTPSTTTDLSTDLQASVNDVVSPSLQQPKTNDNTHQSSLIDLISRYVFIETFLWRTSSNLIPVTMGVVDYINHTERYLKRYPLPQSLLERSSLIRQKLNNFLLFKSDIQIDIKVNSNPFQQGELLIAYYPRSRKTSEFRSRANEYLSSMTSSIYKTLNLEQGNSLTLTIPYANSYDMIDLTDPDNAFGNVTIYALTPLQSGNDNQWVDCTVRMRFVNPRVEVPTDTSILLNTTYLCAEQEALASVAASGRLLTKRFHAQSYEGEREGPVTKIASGIGTIAGKLSNLPLIGFAAGITAWFARGVQAVASAYGWSKPVDLIMPQQVTLQCSKFMGNTEGKDQSHVLAQIADNGVVFDDMVPSGRDEMDLDFIRARPNIIDRFHVQRDNFTKGSLLFSWSVAPITKKMAGARSNFNDLCLGSFSYSCALYRQWRGGIDYALTASKTCYHSARLIAVYFPNLELHQLPFKFSDEMTTNQNIIFDLTAKAEEEFSMATPISIPYTSNEAWKRVLYTEEGKPVFDTMKTGVGCVGVYCLNELVCPETVSPDLDFTLAHVAGKGFETSIPGIYIKSGFSNTPSTDAVAKFIALHKAEYFNIYALPSKAGISGNYTLTSTTSTIIINQLSQSYANYDSLIGKALDINDGGYTFKFLQTVDHSSNINWPDVTLFFYVNVINKIVQVCKSKPFFASNEIVNATNVNLILSEYEFSSLNLHAQDGTDDISSNSLMADSTVHSDITKSTVGEYAKSLRSLIKRFVPVAYLDTTVKTGYSPASFRNYSADKNLELQIGQRIWVSSESSGPLAESWLSIVSNLYRFGGGSTRTKVFIDAECVATTSLDIDTKQDVTLNTGSIDPEFVTIGRLQPVVETQTPYYSSCRARTLGGEWEGDGGKFQISFENATQPKAKLYEAASDDWNFWFLVGPPVVHLVDHASSELSTINNSKPFYE